MPRKAEVPPVPPRPPADLPDDFTSPPAPSDAFGPLNEADEKQTWAELRALLQSLVDRAAGPADREAADRLVHKLGLPSELTPLFLSAVRERADLEATVKAAEGAASTMATCRARVRILLACSAQTESSVNEVQRLSREFDAALARDTAGKQAALELAALLFAFPELLGVEPRRLIVSMTPRKTFALGMQMGVDIARGPASWREYKKPEPIRRRQYFVQPGSVQQTLSAPVTRLGPFPY